MVFCVAYSPDGKRHDSMLARFGRITISQVGPDAAVVKVRPRLGLLCGLIASGCFLAWAGANFIALYGMYRQATHSFGYALVSMFATVWALLGCLVSGWLALWGFSGRWSIEVSAFDLTYYETLGRSIRFHETTYPIDKISNMRIEPRILKLRGGKRTVYRLVFDYQGHPVELTPAFDLREGHFLLEAYPIKRCVRA